MKTIPFVRVLPSKRLSGLGSAALGATLFTAVSATPAQGQETNAPAKAEAKTETKDEKGAPLPLHQIEGNGGIFSTLSAYLVNPPRNGELLGRPAVGFSFVDLGHGQNLEAFTLTETPWKRLELGFGFDRFDLADLPAAVARETPYRLGEEEVNLFNFNARLQLLKEGEFDQKWLPAVTFGTHYKYNDTTDSLNHDLHGALTAIGLPHDQGVDFTLYASKMLTFLPRPVLLELGGRATEAAHLGLLGFANSYDFLFEANVVVFVTDSFALAAEYRQKPDAYKPVGNLILPEDDWWTIDAAYVVNKHLTLAAGYGHFGDVLNHEANGAWGLTVKYEF